MVLMDIEDLDGAVAELARVLAPGGTLCVGILHPIITSGLFVRGDEYRTFYMGEYLKTMQHVLDVERSAAGSFTSGWSTGRSSAISVRSKPRVSGHGLARAAPERRVAEPTRSSATRNGSRHSCTCLPAHR